MTSHSSSPLSASVPVLVGIFLVGLLVRTSVGFWGYSGAATPPMYECISPPYIPYNTIPPSIFIIRAITILCLVLFSWWCCHSLTGLVTSKHSDIGWKWLQLFLWGTGKLDHSDNGDDHAFVLFSILHKMRIKLSNWLTHIKVLQYGEQ